MIIGIGNSYRSDDAAGLEVVQKLSCVDLPRTSVVREERDGLRLMERWQGGDRVIIVDTVSSGADPGTVFRFDAITDKLPSSPVRTSTHSIGIPEAIALSQLLDKRPASVVVYGIEGQNFDMGTSISEKVCIAIERVKEMIIQELTNAVPPAAGVQFHS